ncbi:polysaccharide deacetylase family protein [Inhella sp. 4Y17]|uniref:Polysaccharide deacetylase family protein n=1 Tax=Inhella gelatinilytica TaxID=2795030 RepID=A0A931ITA7_9BURK|nr:polysaccharide deacetylase family protein [Inhella gelatinilytica]
MLSFDDGPSGREGASNPTEQVLNTLANNAIQPGIKALFFVQTRTSSGGATARGKELLRREAAEGHVLGFHTATPGHQSHRRMESEALREALALGLSDHETLLGRRPTLVRPPGWAYDARTLGLYHEAGLSMLLTDLSASDGKIVWPYYSWRRRSHLRHQLRELGPRLQALPVADGVRPVVVTFHDPNPFTAECLEEYLQLLVEEARALGLPLDARQPFYAESTALAQAAAARVVRDAEPVQHVAGFWSSWRETLLGDWGRTAHQRP